MHSRPLAPPSPLPQEIKARVGLRRADATPAVKDYLVGPALDDALASGADIALATPFADGQVADWLQAEAIWSVCCGSCLMTLTSSQETRPLHAAPAQTRLARLRELQVSTTPQTPARPLTPHPRRKKIKCDGNEPTCSQCQSTGSQCIWVQTKDRAALSRQ